MKNITIVLIFIILVAGVGFYFFAQQNKSPESKMQKASTNSEGVMMDKDGNSRYIEYSKEVLDNSTDKRRVLYFYANWCPTCRPADTNFKENISQIPDDVVLIRINYSDTDTDDEEKALAEKYGITYQHTFVQIDADGNEVTKWNGGQVEELLTNVK